jgi:hypothetical protein
MSFLPINEDHAIQSAFFSLTFNRQIPNALIEKIRNSPARWRADLPALGIPSLAEIVANAQTGLPRAVLLTGAEFSVKRPDGSDISKLTVLGTDVAFETVRYTRWAPTWEKVETYWTELLPLLLDSEKDNPLKLRSAVLQFTDCFRSNSESPDYNEVFKKSDELPLAVFSRGLLWHSHTGWFVEQKFGRVLNQLNIGTNQNSIPDMVTGEVKKFLDVTTTHKQTLQLNDSLDSASFDDIKSTLRNEMTAMHQSNKAEISKLLTDAMKKRIKLDAK